MRTIAGVNRYRVATGFMFGFVTCLILITTTCYVLRRSGIGCLTTSPLQSLKDVILIVAFAKDDIKLTKRILSLGANPNTLSAHNPWTVDNTFDCRISYDITSVLQVAVLFGRTQFVETLLQYGADPDFNLGLYTPLANVSASKLIEDETIRCNIATMLLKSGANVNATSQHYESKTPLQLAAQNGHTQLVELLIEFGAEIEYVDLEGASAYELAEANGHKDVCILMQKYLHSVHSNAVIKK